MELQPFSKQTGAAKGDSPAGNTGGDQGDRSVEKTPKRVSRKYKKHRDKSQLRISTIAEVNEEGSELGGEEDMFIESEDSPTAVLTAGKSKSEGEAQGGSDLHQDITDKVRKFSLSVRQKSLQEYDDLSKAQAPVEEVASAYQRLRLSRSFGELRKKSKWEEFRDTASDDPFGPVQPKADQTLQEKQISRENTLAMLEGHGQHLSTYGPADENLDDAGSVASLTGSFYGPRLEDSPIKGAKARGKQPVKSEEQKEDESDDIGSIASLSPGFYSQPGKEDAASPNLLLRRDKPDLQISLPKFPSFQPSSTLFSGLPTLADYPALKGYPALAAHPALGGHPLPLRVSSLKTPEKSNITSPGSSKSPFTNGSRVSQETLEQLTTRCQNVHPAFRLAILSVLSDRIETVIPRLVEHTEPVCHGKPPTEEEKRNFKTESSHGCTCPGCGRCRQKYRDDKYNETRHGHEIVYDDIRTMLDCYTEWVKCGDGVLYHPAVVKKLLMEELASCYDQWFTQPYFDSWSPDKTPSGPPEMTVETYAVAWATSYLERAEQELSRAEEMEEVRQDGELEGDAHHARAAAIARVQEALARRGKGAVALQRDPLPDAPAQAASGPQEKKEELRIRIRDALYEKKVLRMGE